MVQLHHDEEVAIHIGPESGAGAREGVRRGVARGMYRPTIEPRKYPIRMPTLSHGRKAIRAVAISRAAARSCLVIEPGMYENSILKSTPRSQSTFLMFYFGLYVQLMLSLARTYGSEHAV